LDSLHYSAGDCDITALYEEFPLSLVMRYVDYPYEGRYSSLFEKFVAPRATNSSKVIP
jgi:hypothetical protein